VKLLTAALVIAVALLATTKHPSASGPVGIYGIVERVVFEPDDRTPERAQVWGVFAHVNGCAPDSKWETQAPVECSAVAARAGAANGTGMSPARRGYLYFKIPEVAAGLFTAADVDRVRREWRDLAAVAGTGQAVAFGRWGFVGNIAALNVYERAPQGGTYADVRVRNASDAPASPATYQTNAGVVRLSAEGSHASVVALLKAQLR
jgi:hypothetical protein